MFIYLCMCLAAPGLSYITWDLQSSLRHVGSLVSAYRLFFKLDSFSAAALVLHCCVWTCSSRGRQGLSSAAGRVLLLAGASLVAEHGLQGPRASVAVAAGLSWSTACGIFLDQGLNPCSLHWQVDSEPLDGQGSPM